MLQCKYLHFSSLFSTFQTILRGEKRRCHFFRLSSDHRSRRSNGKMTTRFLSKDAFTLSNRIPRLWERLKTLRITESFVAINSKNCSNGSSTVARLCALKKKRADQLPLVIEDFQKAAPIRGRRYNRLGSVVKWLKETNLVLTNKPEDKTDILSQVKNLQGVLHPLQTQKLKIFTDGSTQMKGRKSENSGFGIVVLDEKNQTLYKEGGIALSERRRIRSSGRAWKSFIRSGVKERLNRSKSIT